MSNTPKIFVDGLPLREIAERHGLTYGAVHARWRRGARTLHELTAPRAKPMGPPKVFVDGLSFREIAERHGMPYSTVRARWQHGARTMEELTAPPKRKRRAP